MADEPNDNDLPQPAPKKPQEDPALAVKLYAWIFAAGVFSDPPELAAD